YFSHTLLYPYSFPTRRSSDLRDGTLGGLPSPLERERDGAQCLNHRLPLCSRSTAWRAIFRCAASSIVASARCARSMMSASRLRRSDEHTSELQSLRHLVCRLL